MNKIITVVLFLACFIAFPALSDSLSVGPEDNIQTILAGHKDKRVTLKLVSGTEVTGIVGDVNKYVVHLMKLSGREFFDAAVSIRKIEAVVVRTRNQ